MAFKTKKDDQIYSLAQSGPSKMLGNKVFIEKWQCSFIYKSNLVVEIFEFEVQYFMSSGE